MTTHKRKRATHQNRNNRKRLGMGHQTGASIPPWISSRLSFGGGSSSTSGNGGRQA